MSSECNVDFDYISSKFWLFKIWEIIFRYLIIIRLVLFEMIL